MSTKHGGNQLQEKLAYKSTKKKQTRSRRTLEQNAQIGKHSFGVVDSFRYLGFCLTRNNKTEEVQNRIMAANRTYDSLLPIMKPKDVNRNTKVKLYKTLIRPIISYGSETWTIS